MKSFVCRKRLEAHRHPVPFIRWVIEEGKAKLVYCLTNDILADTFTKALPSAKGKHFASALGLARA